MRAEENLHWLTSKILKRVQEGLLILIGFRFFRKPIHIDMKAIDPTDARTLEARVCLHFVILTWIVLNHPSFHPVHLTH